MNKKLIALAVAGLAAGGAFAQSNVTVYGVADVYYGHATGDGKTSQNVINSGGWAGSRLGFKGNEDLGDGLKALFTLEYGLNMDDASGIGSKDAISATGTTTGVAGSTVSSTGTIGNARQQYVGLTGGFGTIVGGRLQTAGYDWSVATNALHGTAINPLKAVQGSTGQLLLNSSSRANNAVAYISPDLSGFKVAYNHTRFTESANTNAVAKDSSFNLFSGTYANGPLTLSAIYTKLTADATVADDDVKEIGFGGSYDFGVVKLFGSYQTAQKASASKNKAWNISGVVPVSAAGAIIVGYAGNKIDSTTPSDDSKSYTLAYKHNLSKRTAFYSAYQHTSNDSGAKLGTDLLTPATNGGSASLFVAGVNHAF